MQQRNSKKTAVAEISGAGGPLSCGNGHHKRSNLFASTTFELNELRYEWLNMLLFAEQENIHWREGNLWHDLLDGRVKISSLLSSKTDSVVPGREQEKERTTATDKISPSSLRRFLSTGARANETAAKSTDVTTTNQFYRTDHLTLTNTLFDRMWREGIPILVDGCGGGLVTACSPEEFIKAFPKKICCKSHFLQSLLARKESCG